MKLKKGDTVKIIKGKDKGKTGKVEKALPKKQSVVVSQINVYKRHLKPQGEGKPGGIVDIVKPLPLANVAFVCVKCSKTTKIGFLIDKKGHKNRMCKKCHQLIKI